jgi:hypothetical protein
MGAQFARRRDEEGASENLRGDRCGFLTILDNVLTAGELGKGEEGTGQLQPHPGDLLEGAGGRGKKFHSAEISKVLRSNTNAARSV